ncbi:MAG TPA: Mut7-C RNAse domain-containing protein [Burkholderiaceae bacterium]|jgi:hypothetical protein|nr:Mut7-C RNAse domain-containing protein [Burkholderiaceae bacterium]
MANAQFRFYAELNAFLAPALRHRCFAHRYPRDATVKHMIEALGVPHTEVELILVNGESADFSRAMHDGDRVSVYPHFHAFDISPLAKLPGRPVRGAMFIADAHLGQLAKKLRMLGFDVLYRNSYSDAEVARIAFDQERIVLTRDRDLLIRKDVVRGCYLHSIVCEEQLCEVLWRFDLLPLMQAFSRCLTCNGILREVERGEVEGRVPHSSGQHYNRFFECEHCRKVYWEGSHVRRMRARIEQFLNRCKAMQRMPIASRERRHTVRSV